MAGQKSTFQFVKKAPKLNDPCKPDKDLYKKAAAIVGQVMVHFGAGYGATTAQIFATPQDYASFSELLMTSTVKHITDGTLQWDTNQPMRDQVCQAGYVHGGLAKTAAAGSPLTFQVILTTLRQVQRTMCPPGAGGGPVCDF